MEIKVRVLGLTLFSITLEKSDDGPLEELGEIADNLAVVARAPWAVWGHRRKMAKDQG